MTRRLAAIMFTDLTGFTELAQADEAAALRLLKEQDRLVRPILEAHRGRKVKSMGDGLLIDFPDALDAVECAVHLQRQVHEHDAREGVRPLKMRVGIHLGDVQRRGSDIVGDAVNVASRIEPLAPPGGVCLTEPVFSAVRNKVPYQFERLGPRTLKGVREPVYVYRVTLPWSEAGPGAAATESGPQRIAVLPLTNMSPDPGDEYFADGLTEELISALSQVPNLRVISRTSVMQYKTQPKRIAEIGRELGVRTILEGSVRKAGNKLRIAVQLIDPVADEHLWAENYDRDLEDVFSVQSEIAEKVATSLRIQLGQGQRENIGRQRTKNIDAYALFLKGRFYLGRWDRASVQTGIQYFEQSIAADPGYADAYSALASAYQWLLTSDAIDFATGNARIEECAQRALHLDEGAAEAHVMEAVVLCNRYDWDGAEKELRRALDLDPNLPSAHKNLAILLGTRGDNEGCMQEADRALALDPLSVGAVQLAGTLHLYSRDYGRAIQLLRSTLELAPENAHALHNLGLAHVQVGEIENGLEELERAAARSGPLRQDACLAYGYCKAGKPEEARRLLSDLLHPKDGERIPTTAVAGIYAALGENDKAVDWLEKAYVERARYLIYVPHDFVFDNLRHDPRFRSFLHKMNLA